MNKEEILAKIPLFSGLDERERNQLAQIAVIKKVKRDTWLFREGSPADGVYVVIKGMVKIYKNSWEGKEQVLHFFGPFELFGEVPMFQGIDYPASAEVIEDSEILYIPRAQFLAFLKENSEVSIKMLALLSERLRHFTRLIEDLSLKEVPARLAAYILYRLETSKGNPKEVELDIPKHLLAALLGTTPETLSRVFTRMKTAGYISVEGRKIKILDEKSIRKLALEGKWPH
ncbi:MAG: Crp/Fnr family transcriptional regulator [Deltaproteobacteria bacterium]|nr:Crp/Fnr family transcriptional regulator [Deltaproteobacteria bacterium]MBW2067915.1 Crp/Fnr family transcriptional regulator [Deltaproteobacteria bacterium]